MANDEGREESQKKRFKHAEHFDNVYSENLKSLREKVNWNNVAERTQFLFDFYDLISNWGGRLPNLRDIFRPEEIDWLLIEDVENYIADHSNGIPLIEFVIMTGYEDEHELIIDENGEPRLRRTTAVHIVSRQITLPTKNILDEDEDEDREGSEPSTGEDEDGDKEEREPNTDKDEDGEERKPNYDELCKYFDIAHTLFKIYNRFEANYIDDANITHFHVACMSGCHTVVEKFLELGQDPNCGYESIEIPLHLAVDFAHQRVTETLLRSDIIDPNITNSSGTTALHYICINYGDQYDLAKLFFDINDEKGREVQVDAKDEWDETPLQLALKFDRWKLAKLLLERGAEPYLDDNDGGPSCLHVICDPANDDLVEEILRICGERESPVPLDGTDKLENTPLHLAMQHGNKRVASWLLEEGANPNVPNKKGLTPLHIICMRDSDDPELARMLIELSNSYYHPVQIEAKDKLGRRPIDFAVDKNNDNLVKFLRDRGASSDAIEPQIPMNIMVTLVVVQLIVYWMMHRLMRDRDRIPPR